MLRQKASRGAAGLHYQKVSVNYTARMLEPLMGAGEGRDGGKEGRCRVREAHSPAGSCAVNGFDDGRADDDSIRDLGHLSHLLRRGDAETHR